MAVPNMVYLKNIIAFGWPYLRRYWGRFVAGVLLGVLFGLSNGCFLWAVNTLIKRMAGQTALVAGGSTPTANSGSSPTGGTWKSRFDRLTQEWEITAESAVDPWLPRADRPGITWQQIVGGILFLPLLVAFRGFAGYLSSYCLAWSSERMVNDLRIEVLRTLGDLSIDFYHRSTMGDLLTRVNQDTASLQRALSLGLSDAIKEPMTVLSIFLGLCFIDWKLTFASMVFFPLCVIPMVVLGRKVRKASQAGLNTNILQSSLVVEMLSGIRVVKAFGMEERQVERFRKLSHELVHHTMKRIRAKELVNPLIETISMLGFGLLIVYIAYQQRTIANLVTFLTGMAFIYTPVKKLAGLHVLFQQASVGVDRLIQICGEQPSVRDPIQPRRLSEFRRSVEFVRVSFGYEERTVVQNIDLTIPQGKKLGIAGESGSGKSTLVNLLFRFYDVREGAIRIDGLDLREVSLSSLRSLLALVSQEIVLFDLDVAGNIACGKPGATRAEIEAAARAAYAHEFIQDLPAGYETRIGERGVTLSGGQRQRLAIARAFVRNAPLLVLDEATASLDSQAEAEVQAAIENLEENRTVLCIAHRLSTLAGMDHIIVLSQGRIVEQGTFETLLRQGGGFAAMARKQGIAASPVRS